MKTPTSRTDAALRSSASLRNTRRAGFTLVELAVVVVIVGVMSALVYTRLDVLLPSARLDRAAAEIVSAARFARAAARIRRLEVALTYDVNSGAWDVSAVLEKAPAEEVGAEDTEAFPPEAPEPEVMLSGALVSGIRIRSVDYGENGLATSGEITASFKPSGAVGEHMVTIEDEAGRKAAVYVPALSGAAFVVEDPTSYADIRAQYRLK